MNQEQWQKYRAAHERVAQQRARDAEVKAIRSLALDLLRRCSNYDDLNANSLRACEAQLLEIEREIMSP